MCLNPTADERCRFDSLEVNLVTRLRKSTKHLQLATFCESCNGSPLEGLFLMSARDASAVSLGDRLAGFARVKWLANWSHSHR
jgi:hypothetical protein